MLMAVVEKIEEGAYRFEIGKHHIAIYFTNSHDRIILIDADNFETKIQAVYEAIIQFINYFDAISKGEAIDINMIR